MGYRARMRLAMRAGERHAAAMATARQHMRRASRRGSLGLARLRNQLSAFGFDEVDEELQAVQRGVVIKL